MRKFYIENRHLLRLKQDRKTIANEAEACKITNKIWLELHQWCKNNTDICWDLNKALEEKRRIAESIHPGMINSCACCQFQRELPHYVVRDCSHCPMFQFWTDNVTPRLIYPEVEDLYDMNIYYNCSIPWYKEDYPMPPWEDDKYYIVPCHQVGSPYEDWFAPHMGRRRNEGIEMIIDSSLRVAEIAEKAMKYWLSKEQNQ